MIINYDGLLEIRNKYKENKIVMVKGTFDLFHIGHLNLLERAKSFGDILVVIVKCNKAVKLKGNDRPIIDEKNRAKIIDSIKYTDYTLIADQEFEIDIDYDLNENDKLQYKRYAKIIRELKPDILIKPINHKIPDVLLEIYKENSVQIIELSQTEGVSTTKIIDKIKNIYKENTI